MKYTFLRAKDDVCKYFILSKTLRNSFYRHVTTNRQILEARTSEWLEFLFDNFLFQLFQL